MPVNNRTPHPAEPQKNLCAPPHERPTQRPGRSPELFVLSALTLALFGCGGFGGGKLSGGPTSAHPGVGGELQGGLGRSGATATPGGSGVVRHGAQDASYFRHLIAQGAVPHADDISVEGVFAQHSATLPVPRDDRAITLHPMLGVSVDLRSGDPVAVLQLGLNSHLDFSGAPRLPVNLAVVIDKSGSMNDDRKMTYVKEGLTLMLESLGPNDHLAIITYDSTARVLMPSTPVDDRKAIAGLIQDIYPGGATNLYDGLALGYEALRSHAGPGTLNRLMLLSDGVPTVGPDDERSILAVADAFDVEHVTISTVGVGDDFNHPLMRELALQGGGNFHFLRDARRIRTVFRDELETTLTPIAEDVSLRIEFEDDVHFLISHGLPLTMDHEGHPTLTLPTLYLSRRNGVMLLELDLRDLYELDGPAPIATIHLEYTLTATQRREHAAYHVALPPRAPGFFDDHAWFEHPAIRRNFDLLMTIYSLQDACLAWHTGERRDAAALLDHTARFLRDEARELDDDGLYRELRTVETLLTTLRR